MELFGELFLTASLALFLSFLVAKLVAVAMAAGDSGCVSDSKLAAVSGEDFVDAMTFQGSEAESKEVDIPRGVVEKVDHFAEEISAEGLVDRSEAVEDLGADDSVAEESSGGIAEEEPPAANGVDSAGVDEAEVPEQGEPEAEAEAEDEDEAKSEAESQVSTGDEDDDDWEGIERDELESDFEAAVKFVESHADGGGDVPASFVGGDVQMELYGLRKVATEGSCLELLPQEVNLSDRSKWHAWQRLGNMTRDKAMEKYIHVLSENVPGWIEDKFQEEKDQECSGVKMVRSSVAAFRPNERKPEVKPGAEKVDLAVLDSENKASESG